MSHLDSCLFWTSFILSKVPFRLWRAGYAPADRQTSWGVLHPHWPSTQLGVYSTTLVQSLYISCYLSDNKPVLSYLLSRLLPQDNYFIWTTFHSDNCLIRSNVIQASSIRTSVSFGLQYHSDNCHLDSSLSDFSLIRTIVFGLQGFSHQAFGLHSVNPTSRSWWIPWELKRPNQNSRIFYKYVSAQAHWTK